MKKIDFLTRNKNGGTPFWHPWGFGGCLGRFFFFLLLLCLLIFLLSMFRNCSRDKDEAKDEEKPIAEAVDPDWNRPIENGEEIGLPSPDENFIPPFEEMEPVPNPEDDGSTEIMPNLLYVIIDEEDGENALRIFAEKFSTLYPKPEHEITYYNSSTNTAVLQVPEEKRDQICEQLPEQITEVNFLVVPVEVMTEYARVSFNDPAFRNADRSWHFAPMQTYEAWNITQGSTDVIVGIVDSYMDLNHPELKGERCIYPYSVVKQNADVAPRPGADPSYAGHGTLVTAVAVGNANNNAGSAGIAPKCKFIPVSMGESINSVTEVEGLLYCIYHGASVVNLSCGAAFGEELTKAPLDAQIDFSRRYGKRQEKMWDYVFKLAEKHNTTIVWAAGNENCLSAMDASKRNTNTIVVSAVDRNLKRADFSNFGNFPANDLHASTVSAPGVKIWGALPDNQYDAWDGTSFAAPIIAGVVALIKSQNRDLTTSQIIQILQTTGKPVSGDRTVGPFVQIKDALIKARQMVRTGR